jgi:hypothetical protein
MADRPSKEFGKRRPAPIPAAEPVKRSSHVALLLMGTVALGGGAFALMPRNNCQPSEPGMATQAGVQAGTECQSRGSSSGGGGHGGSGGYWSRSNFFSGDSSSGHSSSSGSESGGVTRGGFGSFGSAFGFSGRG